MRLRYPEWQWYDFALFNRYGLTGLKHYTPDYDDAMSEALILIREFISSDHPVSMLEHGFARVLGTRAAARLPWTEILSVAGRIAVEERQTRQGEINRALLVGTAMLDKEVRAKKVSEDDLFQAPAEDESLLVYGARSILEYIAASNQSAAQLSEELKQLVGPENYRTRWKYALEYLMAKSAKGRRAAIDHVLTEMALPHRMV